MRNRTADPNYRRLRTAALAPARIWCHLCGEEIDKTLPAGDPMCATVDHLEPVSTGGSNTGALAPAHLSCNARRSNRPLGERTRSQDAHALPW